LSIRIEPHRLSDQVASRPFAYVISTRDDNAHVIAVVVDVSGADVDCSRVGRSTKANIASNSKVTLVWPPTTGSNEYDEYTLIADGLATMQDETVIVTVSGAILHRPASL
jgi:hypothetical protein